MNIKLIQSDGSFGPLSPHITAYLASIEEQGYSSGSIHQQICVLKCFGRWLEKSGRQAGDIHETFIRKFLRGRRPGCPRNAARSTLHRLLAQLRRKGIAPEVLVTPPNPIKRLLMVYERFLVNDRNLSPKTAVQYQRCIGRFLLERFKGLRPKLSQLHAADVAAFVQRNGGQPGGAKPGNLTCALRSFLRYLHYKGLIKHDLSLAVPQMARWSFSAVPKYLLADQVRAVLRHCNRKTPKGRRDHAILLLLARLGLRASEVVGLNLEDIDWTNGRITVCGKGRWAQLPLPADAARAIASYLHRDRPRCVCRRVFIRDYAPVGGFSGSGALTKIVTCALARAGVVSVRKGARLLRHSLATDMLRRGASLEEIGEVLRHKSPDTTAIYAKVDLNALKTLALPWPGGGR
jgi:site-specific recombinase XerD